MMPDDFCDGEQGWVFPQTPANLLGHSDSNLDVFIKANAVASDAKGGRFAHIMQECTPG